MDNLSDQRNYEVISSLEPHKSLTDADADEFDSFLLGCDCDEASPCSATDTCACCLRLPLAYETDGKIKLEYVEGSSQPPIVECGSLCTCRGGCLNRVVGRASAGSPPGVRNSAFETFQTHDKGIGLRTLVNVPARTFVCEYAGEVISLEEARKRSDTFTGDTYLFVIQERSGTASSPIRTCIDARRKGSLGSVHQPLV
ncbi:hypothetical protein BV898_16560 [Hypsibius exemplaris]|uniref:Pre-SET domain-containing protein n=1 Tax=Hypsibius exemplaris TaxID=2072580 RepID=A0A9X6NDP9_HYPEX|nr:hypothetical protein BV898_16560 [Hypsibius exemplaris]